jgi:exopolyphosphatase/pppGpp-phosphohydrolase
MRLASIDIGTNTILMLVADVERNGTLSVVRDEHIITRLGKGVDEHGFIQKETFQRVQRILLQLKSIADSNRVQHLAACGTSALRDAANRQEFIDFMKKQNQRILELYQNIWRTHLPENLPYSILAVEAQSLLLEPDQTSHLLSA